ncbi:thiamine pyrophosphate-binding protein [Paenibacillus allorhizosphaerae]|uniref:Thiamine pyrophosphate-containing protein YdaP n=1 Tax=Paenibacillus allorhizosphaerae TaxID=2849866 RepID=A0ABM8VMW6_9BACL|nr:thiamine pyrophosphate-binding protein [Paenibacillus allorhizosphaerae]CAG7650647.1 Putative thiamine pyrophosphate-containing protein YdaP [Paenibacillus allorhizosphaerae]
MSETATLSPAAPQQAPVNAGQPKPGTQRTVAQFVLEQLRLWNVERIYGVIGDANLSLLDELGKQNDIRYIPCRHEGGAALMASAEAKLTGRLAVCLATSGPGIANLLNGLADAAMDRSPVLALAGQVETSKYGTHSKQYIDQQKLSAAVSDRSELLAHPDALPQLMEQLLVHSLTQGQVTLLSIPKDLYAGQVRGEPAPCGSHLYQPLYASDTETEELVQLIEAAQRPVLLIGRGSASVREQVKTVAEKLNAAVVTTLPARPLFPNDHVLYAGGLGQAGSEASSVLLSEADLIVMLGATWWPDDYVPMQARIVQIDQNREAIGIGHPLHKGIVGDLSQFVPKLSDRLAAAASKDRSPWLARVKETTAGWKRRIEAEASSDGTPIPPQRIMKLIAEHASEDAVLAVDTGDLTLWFNRIFQAKPSQEILVSGRWRTLGFALPAAIAAQLAYPNRQVIAIAGDGGAVQTIMEFQTAVEQQLPIVWIVCNNGAYAMEKHWMEAAGMNKLGSEIRNPDFALLAQACGGAGTKAATAAEFAQQLQQALASRKPTLIEATTACIPVPHTKI